MTKFLLRCMLFAFLVIVPFITAYVFRPNQTEADVATLSSKFKLLDSLPSPRLIFVGGSNLAFGLDSKRISDSLNIPVINSAIHAGLGLRFQLQTVEERLKKGDIIVIMPEASNFYGNIDGNSAGTLALGVMCSPKNEWKHLNLQQLRNVIGGFPLGLKTYYMLYHNSDSTHNVKGFNKWGDNEWHWTDTTKFDVKPEPPMSTSLDNEAIQWLATQTKTLRKKGHKVVLFPATIVESGYRNEKNRIKGYYEAMANIGVPFMTDEAAHVMPNEYGYDTENHLNKAGVDSLTTLLINELRALNIGIKPK